MSRLGCIPEQKPKPSIDARIHHTFIEAWEARDAGTPESPTILVALARTLAWRPWLSQAERMLDAADLARVRRRRASRDREQLTLAYALHKAMLGAVLGMSPETVPLYRDAKGCPRLEGGIATTSLSHTDGAIAIAVSRASTVGIDIEPAERAGVMSEIAGRLCHPRELHAANATPELRRGAAWLALWVRKEALLKAAGTGFEIEPDAFEAPDQTVVELPGTAGRLAVGMLDVGNGWSAAVAGMPGAAIEYGWTGPHGPLRYQKVGLAAGRPLEASAGTSERKA